MKQTGLLSSTGVSVCRIRVLGPRLANRVTLAIRVTATLDGSGIDVGMNLIDVRLMTSKVWTSFIFPAVVSDTSIARITESKMPVKPSSSLMLPRLRG